MADKKWINKYRITGIFRRDLELGKRHVVDFNKDWTEQDAKFRLAQIKREAEIEMQNHTSHALPTGSELGMVTTPYSSDYDLLDLKIEVHQVTPWEVLECNE